MTLLQLKELAESSSRDSAGVAFLTDLRLFKVGEESNKAAREIIMFLERQRRRQHRKDKKGTS